MTVTDLCVFSQCPLDLATRFEAQLTKTCEGTELVGTDGYRDGRMGVTRGENTTSLISISHQRTYIFAFPNHSIEGPKRINEQRRREGEKKENEVASPVDSVRAQAHSVKRGNY